DPGVRRLQTLLSTKDVEPQSEGAAPFVPAKAGLGELRAAATHCKGCDLYRDATQTVFGRGSADAGIVFIREQPGDPEDRHHAPLVGPARTAFVQALA